MPLQGLMLILFMMIIFPILLIFTNQNVFFILISIILLYTSLRKIYLSIFNFKYISSEPEEDLSDEIEQTLNINMKRFKEGISVAKNLVIILFMVYCTFFTSNFFLEIVISIILTSRLNDMLKIFIRVKSIKSCSLLIENAKKVYSLSIDVLTVSIIVIISISKYFIFIV